MAAHVFKRGRSGRAGLAIFLLSLKMSNSEQSSAGAPGAGPALSRSLGPWMLWGLGVGYVISGMYFGWNLGLAAGGTGGLAIATATLKK